MNKQKIIGVTAIVVGAAMVLGGYLLRPQPSVQPSINQTPQESLPIPPTTSSTPSGTEWMVLRNIVKGFEIRHPQPIDTIDLGTGDFHIAKDAWMSARVLPDSYQWTDETNCPKTPVIDGRAFEANRTSVGDVPFCVSHVSEGAAGSVYEDYVYVTKAQNGYVALHFVYRHVTDVRIYEGCEKPEDLQKEECQKLQWNEDRDTALFKDILKTYRVIQPSS